VVIQDILGSISRRVVLFAGIGLILVLLAATVVTLAVLRKDTLDRAEWHYANLATALGEQMRQTMQGLDLLGKTTADDLADRYAGKRRLPEAELTGRLKERIAALPGVRMLAFVDARGNLLLHVPEPAVHGMNFSDREHVQAHMARRLEGLYVGVPVTGKMTDEWLDVFSHRVEDARGELKGVVMLAVAMTHFQRLFAAVDLGEGGRVLLFRDDGVLLATHPPEEPAYGRSFAEDRLFRQMLPRAPSGADRRTGILDPRARIVAHVRVKDYPLVLAVSSNEDFVLAQWRRDATRVGVGATGVAAFIGIVLFFLLRQQQLATGLAHDLQEAGERMSGILHSAMDAIITIDEEQRIVLFNQAAERIFRCRAEQAMGGPLERLIPERFRAAHRAHVRRFGETRVTTRHMGGVTPGLLGLRANGEEFPIDASISQVMVGGRKLYTVILRDITDRKRAEEALERSYEELRELSASMNEVREAERTRIARELHDELAQWLTALRMDVSWLASRLPRELGPLLERTEKMKGVVDTTVGAVRRIAADLRPVMLDDLGLVPAIEGLLHDLSQRTGIVVSLEPDHGSLAPGEPVATAIYRMVQEALTNVARHAEATEVQVTMNREGETFVVRVRDNGRGFDPELAAQKKSYGVLGIRERAYTLGGSARVARAASGGTLVEIEIPMTRFADKGAAGDTRTAG
jgi:two-component system sensor histidine kinase UhpB